MKKKNSNPVGALKRTGAYMSSSMGIIIFALVLAALSAVMTIIGPDKIGKMATIMSDGLFTGIDLAAIAQIGVFLAIIYCLSALFGFIQHYIMAVVTLKMSYRMRGELSEKINRVPQKYFNTTSQGDILSRITNDVSTLQQGLTNSLPTIISAATQFVGCLIMMFVTEWRMALVALCITLLGMVLIVAIMSKSQRYFTARQKSLGELNGYVEEMYSGHEVVRISRAVDKVLDHFDGLNAAVYDANWRSQFLSGVMQPLMNVIGNLSYVAVCVFGSVLAINGTIEFGVIVSFILYVRLFTTPLTQIAQGMTNLQTASASAHRIFDFLESEELGDESGKTEKLDAVRGAVTFDHVRFSYPDSPNKVIEEQKAPVVVESLRCRYPQGGEKQLCQAITGKQVPPGGLPANIGCAVFNINTTIAIYHAIKDGMPVVRKVVTVSGSGVVEPKNLECPIGTPVSLLFDACGGLKDETFKLIAGGPMMGMAQASADFPVAKGTGAVLAFAANENKVSEDPTCIRCGRCVEACPMHLEPLYLYLYVQKNRIEDLEAAHVMDCIECGACSYICPGRLHLTHSFKVGKQKVKEAAAKAKAAAEAAKAAEEAKKEA